MYLQQTLKEDVAVTGTLHHTIVVFHQGVGVVNVSQSILK